MTRIRTYTALAALAVAVAVVLGACGGGGGDDSSGAASASGGMGAAETVSVMSVEGVGDVLVDSGGAALYAADEEVGGDVLCTDACAAIWIPLTVPAGDGPSADGNLANDLGVAERPDGPDQVTSTAGVSTASRTIPAPERSQETGSPTPSKASSSPGTSRAPRASRKARPPRTTGSTTPSSRARRVRAPPPSRASAVRGGAGRRGGRAPRRGA